MSLRSPGQNRPASSENLGAELSANAMSAFGGKADIKYFGALRSEIDTRVEKAA